MLQNNSSCSEYADFHMNPNEHSITFSFANGQNAINESASKKCNPMKQRCFMQHIKTNLTESNNFMILFQPLSQQIIYANL